MSVHNHFSAWVVVDSEAIEFHITDVEKFLACEHERNNDDDNDGLLHSSQGDPSGRNLSRLALRQNRADLREALETKPFNNFKHHSMAPDGWQIKPLPS